VYGFQEEKVGIETTDGISLSVEVDSRKPTWRGQLVENRCGSKQEDDGGLLSCTES
jgi:hypothetical protein